MDFESWEVDLKNGTALHPTGFKVTVEGNPSNPSGVNPGKFPQGLTAVEQARLLRCGMEAIVNAAQGRANQDGARAYASLPLTQGNRAPRPVLSFKRR